MVPTHTALPPSSIYESDKQDIFQQKKWPLLHCGVFLNLYALPLFTTTALILNKTQTKFRGLIYA